MNLDNLYSFLNISRVIYWPRSAQLLLCVICCILLWLILYFAANAPLKTHIHHNASLITRLTEEINTKEKIMNSGKSAETGKTTESSRLRAPHLSHALTQLVALANENQLEFDAIKPLPPKQAHSLLIQPVQVATSGHYPQILNFITQLPQLATLNSLGDLELKPLLTEIGTPEKTLELTMVINIYSKATI